MTPSSAPRPQFIQTVTGDLSTAIAGDFAEINFETFDENAETTATARVLPPIAGASEFDHWTIRVEEWAKHGTRPLYSVDLQAGEPLPIAFCQQARNLHAACLAIILAVSVHSGSQHWLTDDLHKLADEGRAAWTAETHGYPTEQWPPCPQQIGPDPWQTCGTTGHRTCGHGYAQDDQDKPL